MSKVRLLRMMIFAHGGTLLADIPLQENDKRGFRGEGIVTETGTAAWCVVVCEDGRFVHADAGGCWDGAGLQISSSSLATGQTVEVTNAFLSRRAS